MQIGRPWLARHNESAMKHYIVVNISSATNVNSAFIDVYMSDYIQRLYYAQWIMIKDLCENLVRLSPKNWHIKSLYKYMM